MALPLVDGIFVALLLAGTLDSPLGMLETGLLIFGGSATVAVILAEMDDSPRALVGPILLIGAVVVPVAALEAVFAVTIESVLDMAVFERFAGVVILTVAAQTASSKLGDLLPSPGLVIGLGLIASVRPDGLVIEPLVDPVLIGRAAATAGIGVGFALVVALVAPQLRRCVDIDRFRFGSSVALGVLALPILGLLETDAPIALAVLVVAGLFAYDPEAADSAPDRPCPDGAATRPDAKRADRSAGAAGAVAPHDEEVMIAGEDPAATMAVDPEAASASGDVGYGAPGDDGSRAPWL